MRPAVFASSGSRANVPTCTPYTRTCKFVIRWRHMSEATGMYKCWSVKPKDIPKVLNALMYAYCVLFVLKITSIINKGGGMISFFLGV